MHSTHQWEETASGVRCSDQCLLRTLRRTSCHLLDLSSPGETPETETRNISSFQEIIDSDGDRLWKNTSDKRLMNILTAEG